MGWILTRLCALRAAVTGLEGKLKEVAEEHEELYKFHIKDIYVYVLYVYMYICLIICVSMSRTV